MAIKEPNKGESITADWARQVTQRANQPAVFGGIGIVCNPSANGVVVSLANRESATRTTKNFTEYPFKVSFTNLNKTFGTSNTGDLVIYLPALSCIYNGTVCTFDTQLVAAKYAAADGTPALAPNTYVLTDKDGEDITVDQEDTPVTIYAYITDGNVIKFQTTQPVITSGEPSSGDDKIVAWFPVAQVKKSKLTNISFYTPNETSPISVAGTDTYHVYQLAVGIILVASKGGTSTFQPPRPFELKSVNKSESSWTLTDTLMTCQLCRIRYGGKVFIDGGELALAAAASADGTLYAKVKRSTSSSGGYEITLVTTITDNDTDDTVLYAPLYAFTFKAADTASGTVDTITITADLRGEIPIVVGN